MVMISESRCPKKLILEQQLCIIIPITLSDTITLRGCTHKEGLELEFEAKIQNKCGIRSVSVPYFSCGTEASHNISHQ